MDRQPTALARLLPYALLCVMVLVQCYLLEHEVEHTLHGEDETCLVCHLAGHQGATLPGTGIEIPLLPTTSHPEEREYHFFSQTFRLFLARGPPLDTIT